MNKPSGLFWANHCFNRKSGKYPQPPYRYPDFCSSFSPMNLSYWEHKTWLSNIDYTIIGSGIVGLSCALQLRKNHPKSKVLVLEKGVPPQGASTKNAGFACFGNISEILAD